VLYQPDGDLQRRTLITVLAGNMEEEMLLTAMFKTTHTQKQYKSEKLHVCLNITFSKFTLCKQVLFFFILL
jgi:hypothetical protein